MLVLSKGCKDARYDKCQPISTIIWTLIKKNCGRLPDIPSWSRTFHVGSVPIVSKSIASSFSPESSFPLTIVNTELPYVVKTKTSPLPSKAQKKLPVVSSCVSCRGPAYVSVKLLQKTIKPVFDWITLFMFCWSQMQCMVNLMASLIRPAPATCPTASPEKPSYILSSFAISMLKEIKM